MKKVRIDGLTSSRIYGRICAVHPELAGLRMRSDKYRHLAAECIRCKRDREKRRFSGKLKNDYSAGKDLHCLMGLWSNQPEG